MIFEMRIYTAAPGRANDFVALYEKLGLPLQTQHLGGLVGFYVTEIGPLNQVVHLWRYASLADRETRRARLEQDPGWGEYKQQLKALGAIVAQDSRIMKPTAFSPA